MSDPFWYEEVPILWDSDRLIEFFPNMQMSLAEKLNAIVRFGVYAGFLLALVRSSFVGLYLPIALLLVTKVLYDQNSEQAATIRVAPLQTVDEDIIVSGLPDHNPTTLINGEECVKPTEDNPFGNLLLSDLKHDPKRPAACPITDSRVAAQAEDKFTSNLWTDVDDVYGRKNASRAFYTMPVTEACNDQTGFAKWLYGNQGNCKDNGMVPCMMDDLRHDRKPVYLEDDNFHYQL